MTTVRYWSNEFQLGRTFVFDEERSGRPSDLVNEEIIQKLHDIILADRRTKVDEVTETVGVSTGTSINILYDKLAMKKLSAQWVPRLLTVYNKRMPLSTSKYCLEQFKQDPKELLRRVVTVDEIWIYHYTPETKQQSKQWISPGESAPKKAKTVQLAEKVIATIFWVSNGVILMGFLEKGRTIFGQYYSELLDRFDKKLNTVTFGEKEGAVSAS